MERLPITMVAFILVNLRTISGTGWVSANGQMAQTTPDPGKKEKKMEMGSLQMVA